MKFVSGGAGFTTLFKALTLKKQFLGRRTPGFKQFFPVLHEVGQCGK